jgi:hypothetical protein
MVVAVRRSGCDVAGLASKFGLGGKGVVTLFFFFFVDT